MSEHVRVHFPLHQDEDGYPPVAVETLWAIPTEQHHEYTIDNIPFFATQATSGDVIRANEVDNQLWFDDLIKPSGNSLLRAVFFDSSKVQEVREHLIRMGCSSEWDKNHSLIAIRVPLTANLASVQGYLGEQASAGYLDYEEPILRQ